MKDFKSSGVDGIIPGQLLESGLENKFAFHLEWITIVSERGSLPFQMERNLHYFVDTIFNVEGCFIELPGS